jgi:hypothetical protein
VPIFHAMTADAIKDITARKSGASSYDNTEYEQFIEQSVDEGKNGNPTPYLGGGEIDIDGDDSPRAIKRRTTIAAKAKGLGLKWHRRSTDSKLVFLLYSPENPPFARARRAKDGENTNEGNEAPKAKRSRGKKETAA